MKRAIIITIVVLAVAVAAIGVGRWMARARTNWNRTRPYNWERAESADAAFSVSFPGHPAASTLKQTDVIDGSEFLANRLEVSPAPRINYAVSWWANPQQTNKPTAELFAHFRDCDAKIFRAKAGTREFIVQGYPAIDIIVLSPEAIVYNRIIRAGPRMYSLWVVDTSRTSVADQNGLYSRTSGGEARLSWDLIIGWAEAERVFALFPSPTVFVPIPKRAMTDDLQSEFRAILQTKISRRK